MAVKKATKAAAKVVPAYTPPPPSTADDEATEDVQLRYREVPQIEDPSVFKVEYRWVDNEEADDMLRAADADPDFRQRQTYPRDVRRWKLLMESNRFVHFLPNGPLCYDEHGMLINGKHRLLATAGRKGQKTGFMVVRNVPRWMFKFFDTPRQRSLNDVFYSAGRMTKAQTGSTMRLAMRYEEFLTSHRSGLGWRHWAAGVRDEHFDVEDFYSRRVDLADLYIAAESCAKKSRLVIASLMVFRFYQQLAWPDGADMVTAFWDGIKVGNVPQATPPSTLRQWARDCYQDRERIQGKRELHLLLLFKMFGLYMAEERLPVLQWAHGFPMHMPYHPDGSDIALKNIEKALDELDKEAG